MRFWGLIPTVSCHTVLETRHTLWEKVLVISVETLLINREVWSPTSSLVFERWSTCCPFWSHTPEPPSYSHFLCVTWQGIRQVMRNPAASSLLLNDWRTTCPSAPKNSQKQHVEANQKGAAVKSNIVLLSVENVTPEKCQWLTENMRSVLLEKTKEL